MIAKVPAMIGPTTFPRWAMSAKIAVRRESTSEIVTRMRAMLLPVKRKNAITKEITPLQHGDQDDPAGNT